MNDYFHFKQFSVSHKRSGMKVGTDGVLLGAWANVAEVKNVLDIGTGTGVIALMIAQRTFPEVLIDAVELNENASEDARENFAISAWQERITLHEMSIQTYQTDQRYDLIITNPPYFVNSYKPADKKRLVARHSESLPFVELLEVVKKFLNPSGRFAVILPPAESNSIKSFAEKIPTPLYCNRECLFRTRSHKSVERILMEFSFKQVQTITEEICLYQQGEEWTDQYLALTKDFYLER